MAVSFQRNVGMLPLAVCLMLDGLAGMLALVLPRSAELSDRTASTLGRGHSLLVQKA